MLEMVVRLHVVSFIIFENQHCKQGGKGKGVVITVLNIIPTIMVESILTGLFKIAILSLNKYSFDVHVLHVDTLVHEVVEIYLWWKYKEMLPQAKIKVDKISK